MRFEHAMEHEMESLSGCVSRVGTAHIAALLRLALRHRQRIATPSGGLSSSRAMRTMLLATGGQAGRSVNPVDFA